MLATQLIDAIDAELPQTQCTKCGHDGCRPYAEAIVQGEAINRCPPGGDETLKRLAGLTGRPVIALAEPPQPPLLAVIREAECIGCTKCIQACPVDAILGAAKQMHTVIESECTGCELCVAPCPVDCIDLVPHPQWQAASTPDEQTDYLEQRALKGRSRFIARNQRLAAEAEAKAQRRAKRHAASPPAVAAPQAPELSPSALRASRARQAAALKRLERKLAAEQDDAQRQVVADQLAAQRQKLDELDTTLERLSGVAPATTTEPNATRRHQKRLALKAAEQSLRHVRQQLAHAKRQQDSAAVRQVEEQLDKAQQVVDSTRAALDSETTP
ncbi:RnfABCDGE type electron transport complex subunit B [Halomonas sp. PAMB 3232]|uniref:RnfABCDGE type electron transport complex subunit B n=1 Tax=Halomonas sp. PAMB 3232 TaxID=3075221 RepID=UPI00289896AA|nr:RnfABCDGE type electron transport complex subunit B [Halomonas sp. PAMB 3232]WNL37366.1 RnfABCDGE type electron transport complex subunit B [Halomonas sp. PAMB 3232]